MIPAGGTAPGIELSVLQLCAVASEIILDKIRHICYNYAIINGGGSQSPPGKVG